MSFLTDCRVLVFARFLQHFALSSISQEPILYDHLGALFPSAELRNPSSSQGEKASMFTVNLSGPIKDCFAVCHLSYGWHYSFLMGFFYGCKGCHHHYHWITRKPQEEALQLPGQVEQRARKAGFRLYS